MTNNTEIKAIIADFDGTIYTKDPERFSKSKLGLSVKDGYIEMTVVFGDISRFEAEKMYESVGNQNYSQYFAKKYNKSREFIFAETWGQIPVEQIVPQADIGFLTSEFLRLKKSTKLIGLTAAPKIWATKVLEFLQLIDIFDQIYSAEDFTENKKDVMTLVLKNSKLKPAQFLVIGDQFESDIKPAQELQMQTLMISNLSQTRDFLKQIP